MGLVEPALRRWLKQLHQEHSGIIPAEQGTHARATEDPGVGSPDQLPGTGEVDIKTYDHPPPCLGYAFAGCGVVIRLLLS